MRRGGHRSQITREKSSVPELPLPVATDPDDFASLILQADQHIKQQPDGVNAYVELISPTMLKSPIENPGRVAYLQEGSTLALLLNAPTSSDTVHYPLPELPNSNETVITRMNEMEMAILRKRGAFELPPRDLCDELVEAYFKWVAPVVPIINRTMFLQRWNDLKNPPPLLLMQAVLLAGSRVCTTSKLLDSYGSPIPAATLFYKRAKALYDADYEEDRVVIVQALILLGWYWEEPGVVTKNVFYWNGLATTISHGFGMHRNPEGSQLSAADKRLWKRIWWALYTRDRSVAVALGRAGHINLEDSDIDMIRAEDFIDDYPDPENEVNVQFFLQYVKLSTITDEILDQHYSLKSTYLDRSFATLQECDLALNDWLQSCPRQVRWNRLRNNTFWPAYLYTIYHTIKCLLHRAYLPTVAKSHDRFQELSISHNAAFQSASAITTIAEILITRNELRRAPPFIIYALLSALIMHIYELRLQSTTSHSASRKRVSICMSALDRLSDIWLVAKMVQELFEIILNTAGLGDYAIDDGLSYRANGHRKIRAWNTSTSDSAGPEHSKEEVRTLTVALQAHKEATLKYVGGRERAENEEQEPSSTIPLHLPSQLNDQIPVPEIIPPPNIWMTSPTAPNPGKTQQFQNTAFDANTNSSYMSGDQMTPGWTSMDFNNVMPSALDVGDW
ncbi:cutinase transcription factor 1 alpha protein [Rutstroemia sp. NJR-2017a WRK4]|nr:cutinase transcription factor 1 alpha protein [Rutstroemia sp. NJR-2017a WRK4]